ncbi:MAG TPA: VWA domain-containing protein [Solirubrobacteraceae bacterium]
MPDVSVSVVPMLDRSGSMADAMPLVIIDAKAFVRAARPGDQIGVVQFESSVSMLYPTTQTLATVDAQFTVTAAAAAKIATLTAGGGTDMGDAVKIANTLMAGAANPVRAYMLLSDGDWNEGPDPNPLVPASTPIFVCGLGPGMRESYVAGMLAKNPSSQYIAAPNAYQMMQVFNAIRGLTAEAGVVRNTIAPYTGTDYTLTPMTIDASTDECQFTVVWSDEQYSYTSGIPDARHVNLQLIDPNGNTTQLQPVIADPGYAIFNLQSPQPGTWQVLAQYTVQSPIYGTSAGFEFESTTLLTLDLPPTAAVGEPVRVRAHLTDNGAPVENVKVTARVSAPQFELSRLLEEHAPALATHLQNKGRDEQTAQESNGGAGRVAALREVLLKRNPGVDPFPHAASYRTFSQADDGAYATYLGPTPRSGPYTIEVTASGYLPSSKSAFERSALATVLVGSAGSNTSARADPVNE